MQTKTLATWALLAAGSLIAGANAQGCPLGTYACDEDGGLWTVDLTTGDVTFIGSMGVVMADIAVYAGNSACHPGCELRLHGVTVGGDLYEIDCATAGATFVASLGVSPLGGYDNNLVTRLGTGEIYSVNVEVGVATLAYITNATFDGPFASRYYVGLSRLSATTASRNGRLLVSMDPPVITAFAPLVPPDTVALEWVLVKIVNSNHWRLRGLTSSGAVVEFNNSLPGPGTVVAQTVPPVAFVGMALVRSEEQCYLDCDASGILDWFDFLCFLNNFAAQTPYADCDASGVWDFFDFHCFQNTWAAGC